MWWSSVPVVSRVGLAVGLVAVALVVAGGAGGLGGSLRGFGDAFAECGARR
jgi:Flp pilus assembly pilin Flp